MAAPDLPAPGNYRVAGLRHGCRAASGPAGAGAGAGTAAAAGRAPDRADLLDRLAPAAAARVFARSAAQLAPDTLETATAQAAIGMVDDALARRSGWAPHEADAAAQAFNRSGGSMRWTWSTLCCAR